jgi:CysZ protein
VKKLSFFFGLSLPLRAARLRLSQPRLLFWSALPALLTLAVSSYAVSAAKRAASAALTAYLISLGFDPTGWLAWTLGALLGLVLLIVGAATFSTLATLIASPLNDFLAESSEAFIEPRLPPAPSASWNGRARLILLDLVKSLAAGVGTLVALLVSWVPLVNFVGLALAALLVCFQYTSYPQTRRGVGLNEGLAFLFREFPSCLGFGLSVLALFSLPWISAFFLPLAVVGGTLLVAHAAVASPAP